MTPCHGKRAVYHDLQIYHMNGIHCILDIVGISGMIYVVLKMWYTWVYQVLKGAIFSQVKVKHQNYGIQPIFIHVLWMFNILSG